MKITSLSNNTIKEIKSLSDKKFRDETGLALIEGEKMLAEALNYGIVQTIVFTDNLCDKVIKLVGAQKIELIEVSQSVLKHISTQVNPYGIVSVIKQKKAETESKINSNFLVLENVRDPGNLGTIIRTAAASNFINIFLIDCVDAYNSKVLNSTMGAIFKVNLIAGSLKQVEKLKQTNKNIKLLAADMQGKSLLDYVVSENTVYGIMLGNEGVGLSDAALNLSDEIISVPMKNNVESLNVAMSAGIIMYKFFK